MQTSARLVVALALTALLSGCADEVMVVRLRAAEPPDSAARARLRVVSTGEVSIAPNERCLDPLPHRSKADQTYFHPNSRIDPRPLGIPSSNMPWSDNDAYRHAEFYVAAGEPIILKLETETKSHQCPIALYFVPEKDRDYEATLFQFPDTSKCGATVVALSQTGDMTKVPQRVGYCP